MIRNIIFDFGKVLVDYDFEGLFKKYIPDAERCRTITQLLHTDSILHLMDREQEPFMDVINHIITLFPDYETEIRIFAEHFPEIVIGEMPGMRQLLTSLKAQGYRLYGLTNWCSKVHVTMKQYPIFSLLDGRVISSEEKLIKPQPEIYQCLLQRYNLQAEETLFVDDRADNIEGGERVGIRGIVFLNAEQLKHDLSAILAK